MKSEPIRFTGSEGNVLRGDTRGTAGGCASVLFMHGGGQTRHSWGRRGRACRGKEAGR